MLGVTKIEIPFYMRNPGPDICPPTPIFLVRKCDYFCIWYRNRDLKVRIFAPIEECIDIHSNLAKVGIFFL